MSADEVLSTAQLQDDDGVVFTLSPQEEEKTLDINEPDDPLKERSDCLVDIIQSVFFHTGRAFMSRKEDFAGLIASVCPSFRGTPRKLQLYSHRERHPGVHIKRIVEQTDAIEMSDISKIYSIMNGLLHCVSQTQITRDFVVFSFCLERILPGQETDTANFQWFEETLAEKRPGMYPMRDRGTLANSNVFEQLLNSEQNWFDMTFAESDDGMEVNPLSDDEGFWNTNFSYQNRGRHEIALKISELCFERNYMALFVWKFDFDRATRVYVNWKGYRLNLNSTSDVRAILNTIFGDNCTVIDDVDVEPLSDRAAGEAVMIQNDEECMRRWFKDR